MRTTNDFKGKMLKIRVNEETKERLERVAKERGMTLSELVREVLKNIVI